VSLGYIQVQTTTQSKNDAEVIAGKLLDQRLAACVQVSECASMYRWQGKIAQDKEFLCTIKTRETFFAKIDEIIKKNHPYEVPEVIATPIVHCSQSYLTWLDEELLSVDTL
jgi:periplasmic divalent cation tolerance protein